MPQDLAIKCFNHIHMLLMPFVSPMDFDTALWCEVAACETNGFRDTAVTVNSRGRFSLKWKSNQIRRAGQCSSGAPCGFGPENQMEYYYG